MSQKATRLLLAAIQAIVGWEWLMSGAINCFPALSHKVWQKLSLV
ncbi:MAG TPA: hypothetical protein VFN35_03590 [Ktedonobacteraceae bacterium]|nr:hypothetical protein [Ktedonobacteraceae bacterium]